MNIIYSRMNFLQQTKLTKSEWDIIEKPLKSDTERHILNMIHKGYHDFTIEYNPFVCVRDFLNIEKKFDAYIFLNIISNVLKNFLNIFLFFRITN